MKEWKVELLQYPLEFFIKAETDEEAIKKAKARVNFSVYESSCEEVEKDAR